MFWILCTVNKQTKKSLIGMLLHPQGGRRTASFWVCWGGTKAMNSECMNRQLGYFSNNWQKECLHSNTFKSKKLFGKKFRKFILYSRTPFGKLNTDRGVQFILKFSMEIPLSTNRCPVGSLFKFLYGYVSMAKLAFQGFRDKIILIMINLRILGA